MILLLTRMCGVVVISCHVLCHVICHAIDWGEGASNKQSVEFWDRNSVGGLRQLVQNLNAEFANIVQDLVAESACKSRGDWRTPHVTCKTWTYWWTVPSSPGIPGGPIRGQDLIGGVCQ